MKNIFRKLFCLIAFILTMTLNVFAADFNISSVIYDNSMAFFAINSLDNNGYEFSTKPKLFIDEAEKKVYFDINPAILTCPTQDLVLSTGPVKEVIVKQFSVNPNIVRVVIYYNDGFKPNDIQLRKLNNSLFVRFNHPALQNYYFQQAYAEPVSLVNPLYEGLNIQSPVIVSQNHILSQINSAFNLSDTTQGKNYILTKKDLVLPTKYYLDNIVAQNNSAKINGIGSLTLQKPIYLTNPERVAFDLPNTVVNPTIRNKEVSFAQGSTIKAGQFEHSTARIVITGPNAKNYVPIINSDGQQMIFADKNSEEIKSMFPTKATLRNANDEITDTKSHSMKLIFSKPIIYGVEKTSNGIDINLFNVDKIGDIDLKSAFLFDKINIVKAKGGWYKLSVPEIDEVNVHIGVDAKTLRVKVKHTASTLPTKVQEPVIVVEPVIPPTIPVRSSNKKYIVIDPGHGGSDCGATRNGIYEKDITIDISKRVSDILTKKGYEVYMTRIDDETLSLQERVDISENIMPDVFVSIHVNSSNSDAPNGLETHYYKDNSLVLAKTVHASMLNHIKANNRGLFKSKFYVINHTTAPAILVEIGFISNASERAQLVTESRKQATAKAIAEGIDGYFK